jgi:hypothetical protein
MLEAGAIFGLRFAKLSTLDCLMRAENFQSVWILTAKLCAGCRTHSCGIALFDFQLSTLDS